VERRGEEEREGTNKSGTEVAKGKLTMAALVRGREGGRKNWGAEKGMNKERQTPQASSHVGGSINPERERTGGAKEGKEEVDAGVEEERRRRLQKRGGNLKGIAARP